MSQGSAESRPGTEDRELIDRLMLRLPAVADLIRAFVVRMPPGAARRRLVKLWVDRASAATARNDVEMAVQGYGPAVELWMMGMEGVGVSECYRGHEGIRAFWSDFDAAFADWRWTVRGVVDGGDRVAIRARASTVTDEPVALRSPSATGEQRSGSRSAAR